MLNDLKCVVVPIVLILLKNCGVNLMTPPYLFNDGHEKGGKISHGHVACLMTSTA